VKQRVLTKGVSADVHTTPDKHYISSNSPVPPLLQVCRESRETMKAAGYALAFPTDDMGPRVWFNFDFDFLYLCKEYLNYTSNYRVDYPHIKPYSSTATDLRRVKKLAVQETIPTGMTPLPEWVDCIAAKLDTDSIITTFGQLEDLLIVESREHWHLSKRDQDADLLGYVVMDVADFFVACSLGLANYVDFIYRTAIMEYKQVNGHKGRDFFQ